MSDLTSPAFEAFCAAMEDQPEIVQMRRAMAFWYRLGDSEPCEMAKDAVSIAKLLKSNPAGDCMEQAREAGHDEGAIIDAAHYAARS